MNETESKYFTEFKTHIDNKFQEVNKNIEESIDDLTISIQHQFEEQEKYMP